MLRPNEIGLLDAGLEILRPLLVRGLPMSLQMFIMSGAAMVMIGFVNGFGAVTSAAYIGAAAGVELHPDAGHGGRRLDLVDGRPERRRGQVGPRLAHRRHRRPAQRDGHRHDAPRSSTCLGPIPLYPFLPFGSPTIPIALHIDRTVLWAFVIFNATFALTRHRPLDRRGLAADDHPGRLDVADPRAVRPLHDPALRRGGDLVELPARHHHLERAVGALLTATAAGGRSA